MREELETSGGKGREGRGMCCHLGGGHLCYTDLGNGQNSRSENLQDVSLALIVNFTSKEKKN